MTGKQEAEQDKRKIALITGGSRGLGAAVARRLASDGYDIWLNYRSNHSAAGVVAREIKRRGGECTRLPFDVCDEAEVEKVLDPALDKETPDVVVNNAGFNRDALLMWMSRSEWDSVVQVSLLGFYMVTKRVLVGMLKRRSGRIVNMASTAGQSGLPGQVNYSAAKAGLIGATKALAAEVAGRNVLVNAVAPGFIDTDMTRDLPVDEIVPRIPVGRFGRPEEVAAVVSFLCSDEATYMTGQVLGVNGGLYM